MHSALASTAPARALATSSSKSTRRFSACRSDCADTTDAPRSTTNATGGKRHYTAPKGRPTRGRSDTGFRPRAFGPVAQWITFAIAVIVIVVIIIMVTGGGDFNPLNDDTIGGNAGGTVAVAGSTR